MNIAHITSIDEITGFLKSTSQFNFSINSKEETYQWMSDLLSKVTYHKLPKKQKQLLMEFIHKVTGYHKGHLKRLISKHKKGKLVWHKWQKTTFSQVYTNEDIGLLHYVDLIHRLSGKSTKQILKREYEVFGKEDYRKLSNISVSHIYNLRKRVSYQRLGKIFDKTKPVVSSIGIRKKPKPNVKPGFLRVDTVHQGDKGKTKGLYFINFVDEVTQTEFVFCAAIISDKYMKPILESLLKLCPFKIINFHSDNGSEYINKVVANILNRLYIKQTKSRPRKHNDNALVETKNGSIIRKHFGYNYIPATDYNAQILTTFCINFLNPYLNYHRPCGFATTTIDNKGKERKIYHVKDYQTPYEKLKSLNKTEQYLKDNTSFEYLDKIAYAKSDTEFAETMNQEKQKAYNKLKF